MIVTAKAMMGSIGGGNLEFQALVIAREMLGSAAISLQKQQTFGLGPALNQCCGGAVTLLFETFHDSGIDWLTHLASNAGSDNKSLLITPLHSETVFKWLLNASGSYPTDLPPAVSDHLDSEISAEECFQIIGGDDKQSYLIERLNDRRIPLYLFGAGHVAKAVVEELSRLPFSVLWIDSRSEQFPTRVPANTTVILTNNPGAECESAADDAIFLIMTHSHELDEDLCFEILKRKETQWLGLIGSETKRKRFEHRLLKRGLSSSDTDKLACPVGMSGITGKRPATIAVSIVAQLLQDRVPEHWR